MTLLDDRPDVAAGAPSSGVVRRSPLSTWRFAARLAQREVRRRPGRTLLVMALVFVPVAAMTVGSVLHRTTSDDWGTVFTRVHGSGDLAVGSQVDTEIDLSDLPAGSEAVSFVHTYTPIVGGDGGGFRSGWGSWVLFSDIPLDDPIADGIVEVTRGRAPVAPDELVISSGVADFFDVRIGSTLRLERPRGDWQVVGIGRLTDEHRHDLIVAHEFDRSRLLPETQIRTLVDLPDSFGLDEAMPTIAALEAQGWVSNRWISERVDDESGIRALAWGWVAGVLALVAVGIVIAAAFATSARRQLVTIGHLSANGAPPNLVRRTLVLQGSWTGVLGALAGIGVAGVGLVVARPLFESALARSLGPYQVSPLHLVVIALTAIVASTIAAAVPARTAATIPVLSALSGRRPLAAPSRRLAPTGLALFLGGLGLLVVAATGARDGSGSDLFALVAVIGAVGVVFGMCCATPLVVELVGRLGGAGRSGTWRLAARSTARARSRSAGVVTAVATTAAFAVAGATVAGLILDDGPDVGNGFPYDSVYLDRWTDHVGAAASEAEAAGDDGVWDRPFWVDRPPPSPLALPDDTRAALDATLPGATWIPVRTAVFDPPPADVNAPTDDHIDGVPTWHLADGRVGVVADERLIDLIGLSERDRALLAEVDVVLLHGWYGYGRDDHDDGASVGGSRGVLPITTATGEVTLSVGWSADHAEGWFDMLISPDRAEAAGLTIVETGAVLRGPGVLTSTERDAIQRIMSDGRDDPTTFVEPGDDVDALTKQANTGISTQIYWQPDEPPATIVNAIIVAAAVLITLLVVAIGLSLSATESRDERDVLVAVGAPPGTLSRVAGAKAVVLAGTGVVLAVPTGYLPIWVVHRAARSEYDTTTVAFPWITVGAIVVAVPVAAGIASWLASSIARRVRPVRMSTLAVD